MDIAFYSKEQDKIIIINGKTIKFKDYPEDKFTPIGIVVIPKSHNVYGDGSCGVMSLVEMNCDTPQQGNATYQEIHWGSSSLDISSLPNFNRVSHCSSMMDNIIIGNGDYGYLPTTNTFYDSVGMSADRVAEYRYSTSHIAPSPYLADGSRNPSYYQTSAPSSAANALADFDGRGNTSKIIAQRGVKDYATWKPTYDNMTDYPAASCCDMFSTVGTEQGDWYLPSCGELGYIIVRFKEINETIDKLKTVYPNTSLVCLWHDLAYWSSSEAQAEGVFLIATNDGQVCFYYKEAAVHTRAFLQIKA